MKKTYQIRKYMGMAAAMALLASLLAGCAKSDSSRQDAAAGDGHTGTNASGNVVAGAGTQNAPQSEKQATAGENADGAQEGTSQNLQDVSGTTTQAQQGTPSAQNDSSAGTQSAQNASATGTQPAQNASSAQASSGKSGKKASSEEDTEDGQDSMAGKYVKSDGTEEVRITLVNDRKISFVFQTSQINGSAAVKDGMAVYHGDDDYSITFDYAGGILTITVDGEDAQQSPMNGIYYLDLGEDDTEKEEDAAFDADMTEEDDWDDFDGDEE